MTSPARTVPTQASTANGHRGQPRLSTPLSTRTRPKGYAALAVALIVGCGALGYYFYTTAGAKVPVVMAKRDIPVGHTITRDDLTTVAVAGGVTAVAAANLPTLLGQHAAVEILLNTLVQRAMVTQDSGLAVNQGLVGVAAAPGQIPSAGLVPGDKVEVLQLPTKNAGPSSSPGSPATAAVAAVLVPVAMVYDVRANPSASGGTLLTLVVPTASAFGVAQASNNGLIALVKVGAS
jgi:SAF domain